MNLPNSATDFRYWYEQVPGYYQARLFGRFLMPKEPFVALMEKNGIAKSDPSRDFPLPTDFRNTDPSIAWWNPPTDQPERFYQDRGGVQTTFLWAKGYVYVEREGGFGSMFGPHATVHN